MAKVQQPTSIIQMPHLQSPAAYTAAVSYLLFLNLQNYKSH